MSLEEKKHQISFEDMKDKHKLLPIQPLSIPYEEIQNSAQSITQKQIPDAIFIIVLTTLFSLIGIYYHTNQQMSIFLDILCWAFIIINIFHIVTPIIINKKVLLLITSLLLITGLINTVSTYSHYKHSLCYTITILLLLSITMLAIFKNKKDAFEHSS